MKKWICLTVIALLLLSSCSAGGPYKRISLEMLSDKLDIMETTLVRGTKVENHSIESYSNMMPVYKITPRIITSDEFQVMVDYFDIQGEMQIMDNRIRISEYNSSPPSQTMICRENSLTYIMQ